MNNIIYSAGVLFTVNVKTLMSIFFFGREYDNKWSDLVAKLEPRDRHEIENTASREAWEESMGCVYDIDMIRNTFESIKRPRIFVQEHRVDIRIICFLL